MTRFGALVGIFMKDLVRRRMIWLLVLVSIGVLALNYGALKVMEEALGRGATWDVASKKAASRLDDVADTMRGWMSILVVLVAAQLAPESRRNGTSQFVLSLGVHRFTLAAAQLVAVVLLLSAGIGILHGGFAVAGMKVGAMTGREAALGWLALLAPLLGLATAAFALSLTASAIETCLVFLGGPLLLRTLPSLTNGFPQAMPRWCVRLVDNASLFFPNVGEITPWPHLSYGQVDGPPYPEAGWYVVHLVLVVLFWTVLGLYRLERHDLGSRTALK